MKKRKRDPIGDPLIRHALKKVSGPDTNYDDVDVDAPTETFSLACCDSLMGGLGLENPDYHSLVGTGCAEIIQDPVFYHEADSVLTDYVFRKRYRDVAGKYHCPLDALPRLHLKPANTHQLQRAFGDERVLEMCDWMKTVARFLAEKNMKPEPFQLELFAEALVFTACSLAPDHTDTLFKLIGTMLGKRPWQLHAYKGRHAAFIVMRRQGKTEWTQIMLAAALVSVRRFDMVYFAHLVTQVNTVMDNIERYAVHMAKTLSISGKIEYNKHDLEIRFVRCCGEKSTIRGKSAHNVNVSNG